VQQFICQALYTLPTNVLDKERAGDFCQYIQDTRYKIQNIYLCLTFCTSSLYIHNIKSYNMYKNWSKKTYERHTNNY
jgi:pantothenate kinase